VSLHLTGLLIFIIRINDTKYVMLKLGVLLIKYATQHHTAMKYILVSSYKYLSQYNLWDFAEQYRSLFQQHTCTVN